MRCLIRVCFSKPGFWVFILKILVFQDLSAFKSLCFQNLNIEKKILHFVLLLRKTKKKKETRNEKVDRPTMHYSKFVVKWKIVSWLIFFVKKMVENNIEPKYVSLPAFFLACH